MDLSLPNPVAASARARPDHPALIVGDQSLTWRELAERVAARAGALHALGVQAGETVARLGTSDVDFVVDLHAVGWLGAALLPLPVRATDDERARLLALAGSPRRIEAGPLPDPGAAPPVPERPWPLEEVRLRLATSGTTGLPRLIPLATGQLAFSAFGSAIRLGHLPDDRWLGCLPLHHTGGLAILMRSAWQGTTVVLHPGFSAEAVSAALDEGVSLVSLVPTALQAVLDLRGDRPFLPSLRAILLGGAPASPALLARCAAIHAPVARTWGMTEAGSQIATAFPGDLEDGAPMLPFARVEVEDGRLVVHGPLVGGRHLTSDRGDVRDGRVRVFGRADHVILSGGENIDPAEIEGVLSLHPAVCDVVVVGAPDPRWGQRPVARVVLGAPVDDAELAAWCRARLAGFKVPDRWERVEGIARGELGKGRG